jgi:site-specific DNA recombinase
MGRIQPIGRRLRRLEPDPATASTVAWIFGQRLAGKSVAAIARTLNDQGVPCPSIMDRVRNRNRAGDGWSLRTVAAILANPRYTGRQVEPSTHRPRRPRPRQSVGSGEGVAMEHGRSVGDLQRTGASGVGQRDRLRRRAARQRGPPPSDGTSHRYLVVGLVRCGRCQRRMDAQWVHRRPGNRCRHGATTANPRRVRGVTTLYLREDRILERLTVILGTDLDAREGPRAVVGYHRASHRR